MPDKINSLTPPPKEKPNTRYNKNLLLLTTTCKHVRHLGRSDFNSLATDQNKGILGSLKCHCVLSEVGFLYVWRGQCSTGFVVDKKEGSENAELCSWLWQDFGETLQCIAFTQSTSIFSQDSLWITKRFKIRGIWMTHNLCTEIAQLCKQRNAMIIPEFPVHPASMFLYCARNLERHIKL